MTMSQIAIEADKASGHLLVPVNEIFADPDFNCRGTFTADKIIELAKDIAARGLVQPVIIRELWDNEIEAKAKGFKYFLIGGFRRLSAYKANEAEVIPCTLRNVKTEFECRDINAIENLQREQLTFWQEAKSIRHYWIADWTRNDIAERVHKSPGWVQQRIQLLEMEPEIQRFAEQGYISSTDIRELTKYTGSERMKVANRIRDARKTGNTKNLQVKLRKKDRPGEAKIRHRIEVEELMDTLRTYFKQVDRDQMILVADVLSEQGNCILQQIMAWSVGNSTNLDLHMSLQKFFKIFNVEYEMPEFEKPRMELFR
jgi:ParB family chromosome partitioning protein